MMKKTKTYIKLLFWPLISLLILFAMTPKLLATENKNCTQLGVIVSDTVWSTNECSAYIVQSNLVLNVDTKLTIEPGVIVKFEDGASFSIRGEFNAVGSSDNPILFTSNNDTPSKGDWEGLVFETDSIGAETDENYQYLSGSIIKNSIVEYARFGIYAPERRSSGSGDNLPYIQSNEIRQNDIGIYADLYHTQTMIIDGNDIHNNGHEDSGITGAGIFGSWGSFIVTNNSVYENVSGKSLGSWPRGAGIYIHGSSKVIVEGNLVHNNRAIDQPGYLTYGGGVMIDGYENYFNNNIVIDNESSYEGGGAFLTGEFKSIQGNVIARNKANKGGGLFLRIDSKSSGMSHNQIFNNEAMEEGGGLRIYNRSFDGSFDTAEISYNSIYDNWVGDSIDNLYVVPQAGNEIDTDARNNWWGSNNKVDIENQIYHFVDDPDSGLLIYEPFLDSPTNSAWDISTSGGEFDSPDSSMSVSFPTSGISKSFSMYYSDIVSPTHPLDTTAVFLDGFIISAIDSDFEIIRSFTSAADLVINYPSDAILTQLGINESDIKVVQWDGFEWVALFPCAECVINEGSNMITTALSSPGEFAVISAPQDQPSNSDGLTVFLPVITR